MASQPVSGWVFAALCCSCSVLLSSTGHYKPVAYDWQWARTVSGNTSRCLPGNRKINCCFAAPIVLHVFLVSGCLCDLSSYGLEPKLCRCKLWHKMTQVHAAKPTRQERRKMCHQEQSNSLHRLLFFVTMGWSPSGWSVATHSSTDHFWSGRQAPWHRLDSGRVEFGWVSRVSNQVASSWCEGLLGLKAEAPPVFLQKIGYPKIQWVTISFCKCLIFGQIQIPCSLVKSRIEDMVYGDGYPHPTVAYSKFLAMDINPIPNSWVNPIQLWPRHNLGWNS